MSSQRPVNDQDLERLSAYLDGELSAGERSALEARLQTDAGLRRELSLLRQTVTLIQTAAPYKAPRDFTLTPEMVRARQPRVLLFPATALVSTLSAVAAIVLVVAGLTLLNLSSAPPPNLESNVARNRTNEQAQVANLPTSTALLSPVPTITNGLLRGEATESPQPAQQEQQPLQPPNTDMLEGVDVAQEQKTATALTTQLDYSTQTAANGEQAQTFADTDDTQASAIVETAIPGVLSVQEESFTPEGSEPSSDETSLFAESGGAGGDTAPELFSLTQLPTDTRQGADLTQTDGLADTSAASDAALAAQPDMGGRTAATDASLEPIEAEAPMSAQSPAPEPTMSTFGIAEAAVAVSPTSKPPTAAPTIVPTDTPPPLPSATPTNVPTDTPTPTPTAAHTNTPAPTATPLPSATPTLAPTVTPVAASAPAFSVSSGLLGFILIIAGIVAFGLFALTMAARRRNR